MADTAVTRNEGRRSTVRTRPTVAQTVCTAFVLLLASSVFANLSQVPWLDLLEMRADQAMAAAGYAEVLRSANISRQTGSQKRNEGLVPDGAVLMGRAGMQYGVN